MWRIVKCLNRWTIHLTLMEIQSLHQLTCNSRYKLNVMLKVKLTQVVFNIHFLFIQMSNLKLLLKTAAATHSNTQSNIKTLIPWDSLNGNNDYISCLSEIFCPNPHNMHPNACWISKLPANITWRLNMNTNFMKYNFARI